MNQARGFLWKPMSPPHTGLFAFRDVADGITDWKTNEMLEEAEMSWEDFEPALQLHYNTSYNTKQYHSSFSMVETLNCLQKMLPNTKTW